MSRSRLLLLATALLLLTRAAHADDDDAALVARGKRLFLQCSACHQVGASPVARIGPTLQGVVGRPVASVAGYAYSTDLKALSFNWDDAQLDQWLQRPTQLAPGTSMAFVGIGAAADRKALIAYLKSLQ